MRTFEKVCEIVPDRHGLIIVEGTINCGVNLLAPPWHPVFHGDRVNDHHTTIAEKAGVRGRSADRRIPR